MANEPIKSLFVNDITRRIEEVIKVDQTSDDILRDEISEYVVTDAIRSHYTGIFDAYRETPNKSSVKNVSAHVAKRVGAPRCGER